MRRFFDTLKLKAISINGDVKLKYYTGTNITLYGIMPLSGTKVSHIARRYPVKFDLILATIFFKN